MAAFFAKSNLKIVSALALAALTLVLVVGSPFWAFTKAEDAAERRKQTFVVLNSADDFLSALKDAETGQRGYLLTGDEAFLEPYIVVRESARGQLKALRQLTALGDSRNHLDAVTPLAAGCDAYIAKPIQYQELYATVDRLLAVKQV
jgi:CHASE3 domain sensor protein